MPYAPVRAEATRPIKYSENKYLVDCDGCVLVKLILVIKKRCQHVRIGLLLLQERKIKNVLI